MNWLSGMARKVAGALFAAALPRQPRDSGRRRAGVFGRRSGPVAREEGADELRVTHSAYGYYVALCRGARRVRVSGYFCGRQLAEEALESGEYGSAR